MILVARFFRVVLICIFLVLWSAPLNAKRSFLVAPTHFYINLDEPVRTQTLVVSNTGDDTLHLRVAPIFLTADSPSLRLGHVLKGYVEEENDISPYIRVSPRVLTLHPGQERDVRLSIHPPDHLAVGAYRAHILFHMIDLNRERSTADSNHSSVALNLNLSMEMAISIYATRGAGEARLAFSCYRDKQHQLGIRVTNASAWRYEGPLVIKDIQHKQLLQTIDLVMLRNTQKYLETNIPGKPSSYELSWQADAPYHGVGTAWCSIK